MVDAATAVGVTQVIGDAGLLGLGAGLAMLGAAIGTAMVQASVGASAMGVIAERPEESSKLLIYYLIPESILIFGFVACYLILGKV
mgnify:CR=1 FL=1